jgi:hypothetical protein
MEEKCKTLNLGLILAEGEFSACYLVQFLVNAATDLFNCFLYETTGVVLTLLLSQAS